jgi:hypothetical protein
MFPQNFQNCLARTGDFARLPAQTTRQRGQFLPLAGMGMGARLHCCSKITPAIPKSKLQSNANCLQPIPAKRRFQTQQWL